MEMARYRIGLGGWEHEAFDHSLYPQPGIESVDKLQFYARFFDTVEVRATFWDDTLNGSDASRWAEAVAENKRFLFTVKLHSSFTHRKELKPGLARNVRSILQELDSRGRLGALLLQFPYAFTNTGAHRYHVEKLGELFSGFPLHVEFRHDSWNQPALLPFLKENTLSPVSADFPRILRYMPCITGVVGDTAYLRLHGRNEKGWLVDSYDARYDYLYNGREVRELARRLDALGDHCREIIVICNNTTAGKAVANALQLQSALKKGKRVAIPPEALRAFPQLRDISADTTPFDSLFRDTSYRRAM